MTLKEELRRAERITDPNKQNAAIDRIKAVYTSPEEKEFIRDYLLDLMNRVEAGLKEVHAELDEMLLRKQLADIYPLLPIAFIAKNYFHKSSSWLFQRINGSKVRGRSYTLKPEEKIIFNHALQDIARRIGSLSIV
ncbi:MAG: DUF5053 domain-containing protein [Prevotellaceae bacterium]|jgi:hypothetical protein|nr:DUF5053 domain-containing protein [Prevotellaceae bacterium]MDR0989341.1 DUF5053 domain-containing protein [Prevotellaceae bacterium]